MNALLAITNERIFHNDGVPTPVPLISLFGASNEEPEDENLAALYDRMLFRFFVERVKSSDNRMKMYDGYLDRRKPSNSNAFQTTITVDELLDVRYAARYVHVPNDIKSQYDKLLVKLNTDKQIVVSDRRKNEGLGVLQGSAILSGRDTVTLDDFVRLIPVWWQRKEDIAYIKQEILKFANPFDAKLDDCRRQIDQICQELDEAPEANKSTKTVQAKQQLQHVIKNLDTLTKDAKSRGRDIGKIDELKKLAFEKQKQILNKNLGLDDKLLDVVKGLGIDFD